MLTILSAKQMQACDTATINQHGIPSLVLMERAAIAVVNEITNRFEPEAKISILCGPGNNGGDGVAIGRLLYLQGYDITLFVLGDAKKYSQQLSEEIQIAKSYSVPFTKELSELADADVIVDAIFGIGLSREVTGEYAMAIDFINSVDAFTIAVDIPSGYCSDSGNLLGCGVVADLTVTFAYPKAGLYLSQCSLNRGELIIADVGIYLDDSPEGHTTYAYQPEDLILRPERPRNANKGTCGKVVVIAGSASIYGACYLSAKAAMTTGSGLVKIYTHANNIASIQQMLPEAMYESYTAFDEDKLCELLKWPDAIIIGPGLSTADTSKAILEYVLKEAKVPVLVDADGLNLLALDLSLLDKTKAPVVLTPHLKEMERLSGSSVSEINNDMEFYAVSFAQKHHVTLVLKNYVTVIATEDESYINLSGNECLATAGSGDVLAGIIGALLGQGLLPDVAAPLGAYIHGLAGEAASARKGVYGVLASDIIDNITEVD